MATFVALLRGINVGGRNKLAMADLRGLMTDLGLDDVRTYVQSGNVVFSTKRRGVKALGDDISTAIEAHAGFRPDVHVLTASAFTRIADADPFADEVGKTHHVVFLAQAAGKPAAAKIEALRAPSERVELTKDALYLHAPDGVARSKLVASLDRALGVSATARNGRTVDALREMLG